VLLEMADSSNQLVGIGGTCELFADDVVVTSFDEVDLSVRLNTFYDYCERKSLQMSLIPKQSLPYGCLEFWYSFSKSCYGS